MKTQNILTITIATACLFLVGCASTPKQDSAEVSRVFAHSLTTVHQAVADALVVTGFEIEKDEPGYLEGSRPRKMGAFVGSGGETIGVWLNEIGADSTEVSVKTAKSFVGMAGQKNWDQPVMDEIAKGLQ